ncbi:MAG: hypothetical protein HZB53_16350 [Chloroflexi bacterium]|nr:hypothetical protein [Chloroflexota bacterium]
MLPALALFLLFSATTYAQGPGPTHTDPTWKAYYYGNFSLAGVPVFQRDEADINNDWGAGSPDASVPVDTFSARWTRTVDLTPGIYRFTAVSDDGMRVSIDGIQVFNRWNDHAVTTDTFDYTLPAGHHQLVVEYYENVGFAVAKFSWVLLTETLSGWRGEYFDNMTLTGSPIFVRDDPTINFNWGIGSPGVGVGNDGFSVRWTGITPATPGNYRFKVTSDDGVRLWVDGHLLIDQWTDHPATTYTGDMALGSSVSLVMEYYENTGYASAKLIWELLAPIGAGITTVDNTSTWFVRGGSASGWHTAAEGFGGSLYWTRNNDWARAGYNWARWYPHLETSTGMGLYEVFVFIPYNYTTTGRARYWISHAGGLTSKVINQGAYNDEWVSLGTYTFAGSATADFVSLSDITGETRLSRLIAWDAVKWVPR